MFLDDRDEFGEALGGFGGFQEILQLHGGDLKEFGHDERKGNWLLREFDAGDLHVRVLQRLLDQGFH